MSDIDKISTYYSKACEFVKQNNAKAARDCVLLILNSALTSYNNASSILEKAKCQAFLDKWIRASKDLYDKGVTDYVKDCFGLLEKKTPKQQIKKDSIEKPKAVAVSPSTEVASLKPTVPMNNTPSKGTDINISGLFDVSPTSQGWCAEIFNKNKNAVVKVVSQNEKKTEKGTGFIISKKGYFLTNNHVVFDDSSKTYYRNVKISFDGGNGFYNASLLYKDINADIALCRFNPNDVANFSVIKRIPDYSKLLQGADCLVIGNAFGWGLAPFTGIVRFTKNANGNLVYTAPSNPGDSGGPVFNRQGECIGINKSKTTKTAKNENCDSYANATPMDKIDELLKKWCDLGKFTL